jgi:ABC-type transport system involved in multi-copper enzyme maturation permease subunit
MEEIYNELSKKTSFVKFSEPIARDTILAVKMLTMTPDRALLITHS